MERRNTGLSTAKAEQLKFRMAADLRERLEAAAEQEGHTLSEEIRQRLETSFAGAIPSATDEVTRDLLASISEAAGFLAETEHRWHEDQWTFTHFRVTVGRLLDVFRPAGEAVAETEINHAAPIATAGFALGALHARRALSEPGSKAFARHWATLVGATREYVGGSEKPARREPRPRKEE